MAIIKQQFTITYERTVDTETGKIIETTIVGSSDNKPVKKKTVKDDLDTEAKVYLEDGKLRLNTLAIEMLSVTPGDRIDIQYTDSYPVIGLSGSFGNPEGGTKLTKTHTLSFKGKKAELLQKYGTEFKVVNSNGSFKLDCGKMQESIQGDDIINTDDIDLNLDDLLDDEVKSSMFQL